MSELLPTFLGIGATKAGSTWLYELMRTHPEIGMSVRRREIHYFDFNYDKGLEWYKEFFQEVRHCKVRGEFSPTYLFCEQLSERISESAPTVNRLLVSLRNPVDRVFSFYAFRTRVEGYTGSFEQFIEERPLSVHKSKYSIHLERLRPWIERDALLALIFEEAVRDVDATKRRIAQFLDVDPTLFPAEAGHRQENPSYSPRFKGLYVRAIAFSQRLRKRDFDRVINLAKRLGIRRVFERAGTSPVPPMSIETRRRLVDVFEPDVAALEELLNRPMTLWREAWARQL